MRDPDIAVGTRQVYGPRLRQIRRHKGWSQQDLAKEMTDRVGVKIDRTTIAKIERGARAMEVGELVAFALALGVEPAAIYLPRDEAFAQLTREIRVAFDDAAKWASGRAPLDPRDEQFYFMQSPTLFGEVRIAIEARVRAAGRVWRDTDKEEPS